MSAPIVEAMLDKQGLSHFDSGPKGGQFAPKGDQLQPSDNTSAAHRKPAHHQPAAKQHPAEKKTGHAKPAAKSDVTPAKSGRQPSLGIGKANDPARVKRLQALLSDLGVADLGGDGQFGPATRDAVMAAQRKLGLRPTGRASNAFMRRLSDAHALSPCVKGGKVHAAGGAYDTGGVYEADVVDKVEVAPDTWVCSHDDGTVSLKLQLDAAKAREWATAFTDMATEAEDAAPVQAALGHDVTPGHDQLHHWWTLGPGRARWVDSPTPWRTLLAQLVEEVKGVPLETLKKWASRWFIEVKGYSAGSDLNRVAHGHPPRGHNVGPG